MIREFDPRSFMINYPALERAMGRMKRVKTMESRERSVREFRVPRIMEQWMEKYVIRQNWKGRPKSLILIGDPLVGKSAWAESQGNPILHSTANDRLWNLAPLNSSPTLPLSLGHHKMCGSRENTLHAPPRIHHNRVSLGLGPNRFADQWVSNENQTLWPALPVLSYNVLLHPLFHNPWHTKLPIHPARQ